ncbi:MAG: hypothetical protein ACM3X6_12400 [Patescibacteria group bacterium]
MDETPPPVGRGREPLRLRPVVVDFGPAGIFAALALAGAGFAPIVPERGKPSGFHITFKMGRIGTGRGAAA